MSDAPKDTAGKDAVQAPDPSGPEPNSQPAPYEVGYKKPPKKHQFQPGKTGNSKGRKPKKLETLDISQPAIHVVAAELVTLNINGKRQTLRSDVAVVLMLRNLCLKGNTRACSAFLDAIHKAHKLPQPKPKGLADFGQFDWGEEMEKALKELEAAGVIDEPADQD